MSEEKQKYSASSDKALIDSVEDYKFEPIKGYPMLNWRGKRPFTSTHYYPAQLKEVYGPEVDGWRNKIYWGDNLQVMSHLLKSYRGKIDLIYIDPPFDSKADYKQKISLRGMEINNDHTSFEEKQYTDIWSNDEYLQFMYERLVLLKELLSDTGSIYIHLDYRMDSYIRLIMDEVFGNNNFLNEIIWSYATGGASKEFFARKHDTLLFYIKSARYKFFPERVKEQRTEKSLERARNPKGARISVDNDKKLPTDVWDIPALNPMAVERLDYPTQKPIELLQKIILASSNPGDIVLDCFMGSGTTQSAAIGLGRRFIGADINIGSIQVTTKRLIEQSKNQINNGNQGGLFEEESTPEIMFPGLEVYNVNNYDLFRNPVEAREILLKAMEINPLPQGSLFDGEKDARMVKIMPVNRIATRAELSELIAGLDYKGFEKRHSSHPAEPVEKITLVCMGHEPDLKASLEKEVEPYKLDIEVVDILRDHQELQFKRDSEARIVIENGQLIIERFYPMNLLGKLSLQKEKVKDWEELVVSVMIDWNYDGAVLQPAMVDIPEKGELVKGSYPVIEGAGTIRVKITDLLSESFEVEVSNA